MKFDGVNRSAVYVAGNGTMNLTFNYTVQSGDFVADLDVGFLKLGGGSINASDDGKVAILSLPDEGLSADKNIAVAEKIFTSTWDTSLEFW